VVNGPWSTSYLHHQRWRTGREPPRSTPEADRRLALPLAIRVSHAARQRGDAIVREHVAVEGIERGVVEVRRSRPGAHRRRGRSRGRRRFRDLPAAERRRPHLQGARPRDRAGQGHGARVLGGGARGGHRQHDSAAVLLALIDRGRRR